MEGYPAFTRESDFDGDFHYALWDDYMNDVDAGVITFEEAMRLYKIAINDIPQQRQTQDNEAPRQTPQL